MIFQRNGDTCLTLANDRVEVLKQLNVNANGTQMRLEHTNGNYLRVFGGNNLDAYTTDTSPLRLNINYYSKGDFMVGNGSDPSDCAINKFPVAGKALSVAGVINTDTGIETDAINTTGDNDLALQRNSVNYITFNQATDDITFYKHPTIPVLNVGSNLFSLSVLINPQFELFDISNHSPTVGKTQAVRLLVGGASIAEAKADGLFCYSTGGLKSDVVDTTGDSDLVFKRNDVEWMRFEGTQSIVDVASGLGLSSTAVYGNTFYNRTNGQNTFWYGSNTAGNGRVEICRYDYVNEELNYNTVINNTGIQIVGNIVDTTVSDERLKTNIEDVNVDCLECVKNIKIKTFEYIDEKYKKNDTFGFIAQQLLENLPNEFKNIIKENKEKTVRLSI